MAGMNTVQMVQQIIVAHMVESRFLFVRQMTTDLIRRHARSAVLVLLSLAAGSFSAYHRAIILNALRTSSYTSGSDP